MYLLRLKQPINLRLVEPRFLLCYLYHKLNRDKNSSSIEFLSAPNLRVV